MARTRANDFDDKKRAILASAAAVLAEGGVDKASMAQIAAEAGVSKALLYHYYPGKDALIFDIIRSHLHEIDEALAAADQPDLPARTRLGVLVETLLGLYRDADNAHKVQLNGTPALSSDQRAEILALERRIVRRFSGALGAVNPTLTADPPLLTPVTMSLLGMLNWLYLWFRDDGPMTREAYADLATRLILDGVGGLR